MSDIWNKTIAKFACFVMVSVMLAACVSAPPGTRPEPTAVPQSQPTLPDDEREDEDGVG